MRVRFNALTNGVDKKTSRSMRAASALQYLLHIPHHPDTDYA
jgi:hypothetical protein